MSFTFADNRLPVDRVVVSQIFFGLAPIPDGATPEIRRAARERHAQDAMRRLQRIEAGLRALPGVAAVTSASAFPGNEVESVAIQIKASRRPGEPRPS